MASSFFQKGGLIMVRAKWCCENINSGNIKFKDVVGELKELIEARDIVNVKEEIGDVIYFWNCWLYSKFRINLPMFGAMKSVVKFIERLDVWNEIFKNNGLAFHPKYLVNGSNYNKIDKFYAAIDMANDEQRGISNVR